MKRSIFILIACLWGYTSLLGGEDNEAKLQMLMAYKSQEKAIYLDYNPFASDTKIDSEYRKMPNASKENRLISVLNQKAFIGGKWYSRGDSIEGNTIINISNERVMIKKGDKITILTFETPKNLLSVKESK